MFVVDDARKRARGTSERDGETVASSRGDGVAGRRADGDARGASAGEARPRTRRALGREENAFDAVLDAQDVFSHPPCAERDYLTHAETKLRVCAPYDFDFVCGVKARWAGERLCAMFAREFPMRPIEYYREAHRSGRLRLEENGRASVSATAATSGETHEDGPILVAGQRVRHFIHRHEPPVLADDVRVLSVTDDVVAVCKPATVPVHPTGQYRRNTVLALLAATRKDLGRLFPIHRLDKNVSGLLLLARSPESANSMRQKMEAREMRKEYVARVRGAFNRGETTTVSCEASLGFDAKRRVALWHGKPDAGELDARSMNSFKEASTKFTWVRNLSDGTSIVRCEPLTGRSHQIRAHLAILGHPIANDVAYGGEHSDSNRAAAIQHACDVMVLSDDRALVMDESLAVDYSIPRESREKSAMMCPHCPRIVHAGDLAIDLEAIWLHCSRYSGEGWEFECPHPDWAK